MPVETSWSVAMHLIISLGIMRSSGSKALIGRGRHRSGAKHSSRGKKHTYFREEVIDVERLAKQLAGQRDAVDIVSRYESKLDAATLHPRHAAESQTVGLSRRHDDVSQNQ